MAEDNEDAHGNAAEVRNEILQLQSEQFRRQEQLERLRLRSKALEDELQTREQELLEVQRLRDAERLHSTKRTVGEDRARQAAAEDDFLRTEVRRLLQSRVPAMAPVEEEGKDVGSQLEKPSAPKQEEAGKQFVHDSVLVSYVQSHDGRGEDYKVSYRIDSHTTVEQLHRDACAYWGCSRKDLSLWKIKADDTPECLFSTGMDPPFKKLQEQDVLNPAEDAHLHLWPGGDSESIREGIRRARQKEKEREKERKAASSSEAANQAKARQPTNVLKTLKHGLGFAVTERQPEEYVDAFRPWPGIYSLLASRGRVSRERLKFRYVAFSDIIAFGIIILLSALCIGFRNSTDLFLLREGVRRALVEGIEGETEMIAEVPWAAKSIGLPEDTPFSQSLSPGFELLPDLTMSFNGSFPGRQIGRSTQALPLSARSVTWAATYIPLHEDNCSTAFVLLAGGHQAPSEGQPQFGVHTSCHNVTLVAANGSEVVSTSPACREFGTSGGAFTLVVSRDGVIKFNTSSGCLGIASGGNWNSLGNHYIFMFFGGTGGGRFEDESITAFEPLPVPRFSDIRTFIDLMGWLSGPLLYQLGNPESTLNQNYKLASAVHVRQQKAKAKECDRKNVPFNLQRSCSMVKISPDTQRLTKLELTAGNQFLPSSARVWRPAEHHEVGLTGAVQRYYDSSGFSVDIPGDYIMVGNKEALIRDVKIITGRQWLSTATRLLSLECLLMNKDGGGHVVVRLALECPPSGALKPLVSLISTRLAPSYGNDVADLLDIARWVMFIAFPMGIRVWRETKRQVILGRNGLGYVFSVAGFLDAMIVASFLTLQVIRLNGSPKLPSGDSSTFRSYSLAAEHQMILARLEAFLLCLLILRLAMLMCFVSKVYYFFRALGRSLHVFAYYLIIFAPVFVGTCFLAHAIYSPYFLKFSTYLQAFATVFFALEDTYPVEEMTRKSDWTIPFLCWFYLAIVAFLMQGFLGITVHAFFEVNLVESLDHGAEHWSRDQWLQWMLWGPVYRWASRGKAGTGPGAGDMEGEQEDEDSSSDEEEEKRV